MTNTDWREFLLKRCLLPLGDTFWSHPMIQRLAFLETAQWWRPEKIAQARLSALKTLVEIAYAEVPFYQDLYSQAHVKPSDIRRLADLTLLPPVNKSMLRPAYPAASTRHTGSRTYEIKTSGSTGENFRILEDNATAAFYRAAFLLALEWAGWTFGQSHLQTGMSLKRDLAKKLKDTLLGCYYFSAYDLRNEALDRCLEILDRKKLQHLWGYPGSIYYLAKRAGALGWNSSLSSCVTWGDNLTPHYRKTIEHTFHTKVTDTYGCAEGFQIAAQCGIDHRYHVHSLDILLECLDDSGHPVPPGTTGHLHITRLHPGPMPFIRYRVGDLGVASPDAQCPCGRGWELLDSIQGRAADVVYTPEGNRLIVHFFTGILEHYDSIHAFQVIQEHASAICIKIVPSPTFSSASGHEIIRALRAKGLNEMEIQLETTDAIPLTPGGKLRFVINRLDPDAQPRAA